MCGIYGFFTQTGSFSNSAVKNILNSMGQELIHRGPDGGDIWIDTEYGIALGHRRLSVMDLSLAGTQPMKSSDNRYVIVFNGEIYNHLELREYLKRNCGFDLWQGQSDTETLVNCFAKLGVEKALKMAVGMFAFAVFDQARKMLILGRDRFGEKPLYYGFIANTFVFASQLNSIRKYPKFNNEIDLNSLSLYLKYGYVPAPKSIYKNVYKLMPGSLLKVEYHNLRVSIEKYWDLTSLIEGSLEDKFMGSEEEAIKALDSLLRNITKQQMLSDVPIGAFLSGGVDSSLIVALMQAQSTTPIKTYTIGFNEREFNEADYALQISKHLGSEHTELYVSSFEAMKVIPLLPKIYDEPFSDSSQIPTYLISKLARSSVTVALSGDGGDELFCGYNRYLITKMLGKTLEKLPTFIRIIMSNLLRSLQPSDWDKLNQIQYSFMPQKYHISEIGNKIYKLADILKCPITDDIYDHLVTQWDDPSSIISDSSLCINDPLSQILRFNDKLTSIEKMMVKDLMTYLPGDCLTKVDRAAMSVSLETRAPFLDHRLVEFAWKLPLHFKMHGLEAKYITRKLLYKYVPKALVDRKKMGFAVPVDLWLRTSLRDWAEALLDEKRMSDEGFFHVKKIRNRWTEHLSGKRNWGPQLWNILMFQAWLEHERSK